MSKYRDGDADAFEVLYTRHKGGLYRYFLRKCGNTAIAEELFQDVWLKVIGARLQYETRAKFRTWLYQMAHNHFVDHYRRQKASAVIHAVNGDCDPEAVPDRPQMEPQQLADIQEQAGLMKRLVAELPDEQREAFVLREDGGFSIDEIAAITGVNSETAKSRLRYAVNKLRTGMMAA